MCRRFKVDHYPTVRLGLAPDFAAEDLDSLTPVTEHDVKGIVGFIERQLDT